MLFDNVMPMLCSVNAEQATPSFALDHVIRQAVRTASAVVCATCTTVLASALPGSLTCHAGSPCSASSASVYTLSWSMMTLGTDTRALPLTGLAGPAHQRADSRTQHAHQPHMHASCGRMASTATVGNRRVHFRRKWQGAHARLFCCQMLKRKN
jgi:hypothetical protein